MEDSSNIRESMEQANVRLVRYADDFVILTKSHEEAERVLEAKHPRPCPRARGCDL